MKHDLTGPSGQIMSNARFSTAEFNRPCPPSVVSGQLTTVRGTLWVSGQLWRVGVPSASWCNGQSHVTYRMVIGFNCKANGNKKVLEWSLVKISPWCSGVNYSTIDHSPLTSQDHIVVQSWLCNYYVQFLTRWMNTAN